MKRDSEGKEETKTWKRDTERNEGYLETPLPFLTELPNGATGLACFSTLGTCASSMHSFPNHPLFFDFYLVLFSDLIGSFDSSIGHKIYYFFSYYYFFFLLTFFSFYLFFFVFSLFLFYVFFFLFFFVNFVLLFFFLFFIFFCFFLFLFFSFSFFCFFLPQQELGSDTVNRKF